MLSRPLSNAVIALTTFQLGALLQNWAYDHRVLWESSTPSLAALQAAQTHYTYLADVPHAVQHTLHSVFALSIAAHLLKLFKANDSNKLFDGASLILTFISMATYKSNFVRGIVAISLEEWGPLGRQDTIKVVAASNVIIAIILFGVVVLQVGQQVAENAAEKELVEINRYNDEQRERQAKHNQQTKQAAAQAKKQQLTNGDASSLGDADAASSSGASDGQAPVLTMAKKGADSSSTASTPSKARKRKN